MATKKKSKASRKGAAKPKSKKSGKRTAKKAVKQAKPTTANAAKAPKRAQRVKASGKKQSGLDAAARVLKEAGKPMKVKAIVEMMLAKGYWRTTGQTPWATIYSSMFREIATKGKDARFKKTDRGSFAFNR